MVITQAKLGGSPAPAKKRTLDDVDSSPTALSSEEQQKKQRPTLLDTKRIKKPSRYESTKSEDDNEVDSEDSELDEGEEEEDESLDGEEESLDSAAADEDENEHKFNEEDDEDDDDDDENEVGDAIEEPAQIVRGQGSGNDCDAVPELEQFFGTYADDDELDGSVVGEAIEEPVYLVIGFGSGAESLVGNGKNETSGEEAPTGKPEPKATFFFGEPGCLKLSPIKQAPKPEAKRSIFDSLGQSEAETEPQPEPETEPEKTNGERAKLDEATNNDSSQINGNEISEDTEKKSSTCEAEKVPKEPEEEVEEKETSAKENTPEEITEESHEVKEISNEQTEKQENNIKLKETDLTPVYKVKVVESHNETTPTESNKSAEAIEPIEPIVENHEKVKEIKEDDTKNVTDTVNAVDQVVEKAEIISDAKAIAVQEDESIAAEVKEYKKDIETIPAVVEAKPTAEVALKPTVTDTSNGAETDTSIEKPPNESVIPIAETVKTVQNDLPSTSKMPASPTDSQKIDLKVQNEKEIGDISKEKDKIESRESKESKADTKTQLAPECESNKRTILLPNRKRRLTDFAAANPRHSTSESEVDAHAELPLEEEQQPFPEEDDDDLDVGGKRLKMRPKITNVEVRRKVEAQKTQIEETTSSSGEEDPRSRRKIIAPKRHLEKPINTSVKVKPTLAEIIEKKLKKTPEKQADPIPVAAITAPAVNELTPPAIEKVETLPFTPPKKSPITKPLKKNLLTQIRQEESDEEAIPRKRTNSETVTPSTPPAVVEAALQRKRRSSEEAKESKESSANEEPPAVSEKLKRNNEEQCLVEETTVVSPQTETIEREVIPAKQEDLPVNQESQEPKKIKHATPPPVKEEKPQLIKEATPPPAKEETPPPAEASGRRSGRRGGAAVVYTELPQPKRTRGGPKEKGNVENKPLPKEDSPTVVEKPEDVEDIKKEEEEAELPIKAVKSAAKAKTPVKEEIKVEPVTKLEPAVKLKSPKEEKVTPEKPATTVPATPGVGRGRGPRKKREVDTTNIIETNDSETPVRQSRRIAQQKIKEEAERRKLEEVALRSMKQELKKKKMAEKETDPTVLEPSGESESGESASEAEEAKKKIKKKCPGKDGWSSDSEEQAETEEEEEEPPHYETDPGSPLFKSDHEFSPESELEDDSQMVPMKRARTLRKENAEGDDEAADADEACQKCGKSDHPEWILLCDTPGCNKGYHCSCLSPVIFYIPEGDWHCPPCQQEKLIAALEQQLLQFDDLVELKQQEKRLAEQAVVSKKPIMILHIDIVN